MGNETGAAGAAVIGEHYDERSPIGDELRDGQIHMWYWYDDTDDDVPLTEAVHRVSRKVADTLGLRPGEHVLDAGCGPGATAVFLARTFGVRVTGVNVSGFEIDKARQRAAAAGLTDQVTFEYGDYAALTHPDGAFDAVLALESLQNAADLGQVLGELFRVLRPGGRLTFSDFSLESDAEPRRIAKFMETLKLPVLPTLPGWLDHLRAAGFEIEEYTQCGPRVFGRKAKYLRVAMSGRDAVAAKFGDEAVSEFSRLHSGFFAPRKDQIGYVIVSARKPIR
ncbi:27-O-demethylrifamycin SV methyltransferase [Sphaerisporangium rubeum]|uniref:Ubiquinone/menaquinone biosynthesis C-methylase UbiE n=1 Tax=Sphaerisporangium rubeum TaxID=321317 RepID=A0A7X0M7A5_9ACTN|nr:methyltransferase domain-containing protein [Sphaerisporangium rubeum]MBB6472656.1 ubiquinone/menaquinone biosynthesis C-methylase UbiE [Sphaerisporangium rubeum]